MIYQVHKDIVALLKENISRKVFTSCEAGFFCRDKEKYTFYTIYIDKEKISFKSDFYFDLASLTKVLVTIPCLWSLVSEKKIELDTRLSEIYAGARLDTSIYDLVNHISGLSAHKYFINLLNIPEKERFPYVERDILKELFKIEEKRDYIYSDLGYIILGIVIEKISGKKLDEYWFEKIYIPLDLHDLFFPSNKISIDKKRFISTGVCPWSKELLQGVVHDDNCRLLGGVCGHAGLFGNCSGVLHFFNKILLAYNEKEVCTSLSNRVFIENIGKKRGTRRFGFDTPAEKNSSCGDYFSKLTIGHLGFTGTSAWLDLQREAAVVFLTNRTYRGSDSNSEEIRALRPKIHNIIMKNIPYKGE